MTAKLDQIYTEAGNATGALVIPVGLAVAPVGAMRAASRLRFIGMPSEPSRAQATTWRRAGLATTAIGILMAAIALG